MYFATFLEVLHQQHKDSPSLMCFHRDLNYGGSLSRMEGHALDCMQTISGP